MKITRLYQLWFCLAQTRPGRQGWTEVQGWSIISNSKKNNRFYLTTRRTGTRSKRNRKVEGWWSRTHFVIQSVSSNPNLNPSSLDLPRLSQSVPVHLEKQAAVTSSSEFICISRPECHTACQVNVSLRSLQLNKGNQKPPAYCITKVCHRKLGNAATPGIVR